MRMRGGKQPRRAQPTGRRRGRRRRERDGSGGERGGRCVRERA
jgi:hypothetical protein